MEQDMKYIYQVYQDGSFSAAAEHLYMSQPALSIAVKRVEEAIGAEIFDRSRRPVALTEAGQAYIDTLHYIRYLEEDLAHRIEDLRGLQTGTLRLGGTHFLNCYILAPILAEFNKQYPGIQLELFEDSALKLQGYLHRRDIDLTLSCAPEIVEQFEHKPAFYDHVLLAVPCKKLIFSLIRLNKFLRMLICAAITWKKPLFPIVFGTSVIKRFCFS